MSFCCCALAGTRACLTCPNSMAGTWDRYPAPYVGGSFWEQIAYKPPVVYGPVKIESKPLDVAAMRAEVARLLDLIDKAREATKNSKLIFGESVSPDEELALEEQVAAV